VEILFPCKFLLVKFHPFNLFFKTGERMNSTNRYKIRKENKRKKKKMI
jgi:hypothetical protein